jgi:hypothetical protein
MSAIFNSGSAKCAGLVWFCAAVLVVAAVHPCVAQSPDETPFARAERILREARAQASAEPKNSELAWQHSRACFDAGEFAPTDAKRAEFAQEGIAVARKALDLDLNLAPGHYYLGLNLGQLARTKSLGALKLVDEMESSFYAVIRLNAGFDFAGAHRCLGLLYRDAPGWPISVGSRSKARQHLTKAVELSREYPDNWLCLIEAYIGWGERDRARAHYRAAQEHFNAARKRFTGVEWRSSWESWDARLKAIQSKLPTEKLETPKAR